MAYVTPKNTSAPTPAPTPTPATTTPAPNTPVAADGVTDRATFIKRFPTMAWILNEPGVADAIFSKDVTNNDELQAALEGTDWWRQTQDSVRQYQQLQAQDPATFSARVGQKAASVNDLFQSMGLNADPAAQSALADQAIKLGWSDNQLNDAIVSYARTHPTAYDPAGAGSIQSTVGAFKQAASAYYVGLDDRTAQNWAQQVVAGEKKAEDFTNVLQSWAKNKFANSPDVINALNSGVTPDAYFGGYKTEAAKLLEMDPNQIDLNNNPLFSKILTGGDAQGGTNRVMSMSQMDQYLRTTDQYNHTQGAINNVVGAWTQVAKLMGKQA